VKNSEKGTQTANIHQESAASANGKKIVKRKLIAFVLFICIFAIVACGVDDYPIDDPAHDYNPYATVITIAWWGSDLRHERTNAVLRLFEEENPHIRFEAEYFDFDGYFTNLRARVLAGDVWDIFQLGGNYPEFISSILPLNDLIASESIDIRGIDDEFLNLTTSGGNVVGLSLGVNAWGIAYDPVMFRQAGVPMPHPLWTWEDFTHAALAISSYHNVWGVGSFPDGGIALTQYLTRAGIPLFHEEDVQRLGLESYEPIISFLEMMETLSQHGAIPSPLDALFIPTIEENPLVSGRAGMAYIASNQLISLANAALALNPYRELAMGLLPGAEFDGSGALVSSQMFSIFSGTEHSEYAAQFISFFVNDCEANRILLGERGVPISTTARDAIAEGDCPFAAAVSRFVSDISYARETAEVDPLDTPSVANPARGRVENFIGQTVELVKLGRMSPEEGARAIFDFATEAVAANVP